MHDIRQIRDDPEAFDAALGSARGRGLRRRAILTLDSARRAVATRMQEAQNRRNEASKAIGAAMGKMKKSMGEDLAPVLKYENPGDATNDGGMHAFKAEVAELKNDIARTGAGGAQAYRPVAGRARRASQPARCRCARWRGRGRQRRSGALGHAAHIRFRAEGTCRSRPGARPRLRNRRD